MTCLHACPTYQANLGTHAPGCPNAPTTPSTPASVAVSSAWEPDAGVSSSPRLQPGEIGDAPPQASPLPSAVSGPVAVEAALGSIFTSRTAAVLSLLAALVVFAAAAGLVWGVAR